MKKSPLVSNSLVQPLPMEDRGHYITRFLSHKAMIALFADKKQRKDIAEQMFTERWNNALVTIKKLNGEMFFID